MRALFRWGIGCALATSLAGAQLIEDPQNGLRLPAGFKVTQVADSALATDIQALTFNARGELVVSGPGYIKTLLDSNKDNILDRSVLFAPTQTGAMGLCFDGSFLYATADQAVWRYLDDDGDNQADGNPQRLFPMSMGEHGGHAIRKGPDGWFYLVAGNDTRFTKEHATLAQSPIRAPEAGGFLRFSSDGKSSEIIAQGFRNPYDFDFFWTGDIFTFDSDTERDFLLPWYKSTRLYHVNHGGHHGWRLNGFQRSWSKPDYYEDTAESLFYMGRGSPTGMVAYRHEHFPLRFRQGFFAADWTFGKIYFFNPVSDQSSYKVVPEVFLEPIGTHGFAPTDMAVGPDGALYIAIGGRKTRGGVYRVHFGAVDLAGGLLAGIKIPTATSPLEDILKAPQPLDGWSRQIYEGPIRSAGRTPFANAMINEQLDSRFRVRAIEILTEHFNGLTPEDAGTLVKSLSIPVRARTAWSLGRVFTTASAAGLRTLAEDPHPLVRKIALDSLADRLAQMDASSITGLLLNNLDSPDRRVRQSAARLAARLPEEIWTKWQGQAARHTPRVRLGSMFALIQRNPGPNVQVPAVNTAAAILTSTRDTELRRNALRLLIASLSDNRLNEPTLEVYTGYELALELKGIEGLQSNLATGITQLFPSGDATFDFEAARLLAMLQAGDPNLPAKILRLITATSSPVSDLHYLIVLSRLTGTRTAGVTKSTADALLNLDRKLEGKQAGIKQQWNLRFTEMASELMAQDAQLVSSLLSHARFVQPNHVELALMLNGESRVSAASLFLKAVEEQPSFRWTPALLELLSHLPHSVVKPVVRKQWAQVLLREDLALLLAKEPEATDREKFLAALDSSRPAVIQACIKAIAALPVDRKTETIVALTRLLRQLTYQGEAVELRRNALNLLSHYSGQAFLITETSKESGYLRTLYAPIFQTLEASYPELAKANGLNQQELKQWSTLLKTIRWEGGNPVNGEGLFVKRGCAACHLGNRSLGPDLAGAAQRFSAGDLFDAILFPNRDVAPIYKTSKIVTRSGEVHQGVVVFEAADGVLLQTGLNTTLRLANSDIVSRESTQSSLMPTGLLEGLNAQELTDLYAYLRTLKPPPAKQ